MEGRGQVTFGDASSNLDGSENGIGCAPALGPLRARLLHLAEEIEDLEKNERRLLRHQISLLLGYLLKRAYGPSKMLRARGREWELRVQQARHHIASLLKESPGLFGRIDEIFAQAYESGRDNALFVAELPNSAIPETPPWTFEEVIDDSFGPKRGRVGGERTK